MLLQLLILFSIFFHIYTSTWYQLLIFFLASFFTSILRHGTFLNHCVIVFLFLVPKGGRIPLVLIITHPLLLLLLLSVSCLSGLCLSHSLLTFPPPSCNLVLSQAFRQLCTGVLKNVVSHYMFEDSPVYACFQDASKAFDLVNHEHLLTKLLRRGFPVALVRLLIKVYSSNSTVRNVQNSIFDVCLRKQNHGQLPLDQASQ